MVLFSLSKAAALLTEKGPGESQRTVLKPGFTLYWLWGFEHITQPESYMIIVRIK
jgi:hypothetical protein